MRFVAEGFKQREINGRSGGVISKMANNGSYAHQNVVGAIALIRGDEIRIINRGPRTHFLHEWSQLQGVNLIRKMASVVQ
jgi:hypothetical protein